MTKQEFKAMCHKEFIKRGFKKQGKTYTKLGADGLQCALSFQSSYGVGYYINCDYYLSGTAIAVSPATNPDISGRVFRVLSKDTIKGKPFMTAAIYHSKYTPEELIPFIEQAFEEYVLPPLEKGKTELLDGIINETWHFTPHSRITIEDI